MDTRRDFLKKAILFSGTTGLSTVMPASIKRALEIEPAKGSTYLDAEHVVILMQENRSFDHCFGTLRGVRGFNDPRAITQPDKNLVWLQSNKAGETHAPFRFNIKDTKATWMGSIPHSRASQVDANNKGKYDGWLEAKRSGHKKYHNMPLTMGHYNRDDLPFNYAFADAFTICDQNFSSGMTCTWPNRLYFWSGTIRGEKNGDVKAFISNDIPYGSAHWKTFPEHLEQNDISWKIYQNDLSAGGGLTGDQRSWLSNFGCNPLEFLSQYNVRYFPRYVQTLKRRAESLPLQIDALEKKISTLSGGEKGYEKLQKEIAKKKEVLADTRSQIQKWSKENYEKLSPYQKNLYNKAFSTNADDPDYHELTTLKYENDGQQRELPIPKGDVLYQFRKDVDGGKLPTVSWLVPSQNFSDHPSAPWYGAWLTSEILDILTKNPEVWKKTIFILTYDENDGYFDHIPPFVAPDPENKETGKCSPGVNTTGVEFIRREQELKEGFSKSAARTGPIGLGFRVPMIIASPWSRGGKVCSQVFDHTSTLQFLEGFLNKKFNKEIRQDNISAWRRTVCGDLTAAFSDYKGGREDQINFLKMDPFIEKIYNAKFQKAPKDYKILTPEEIAQINRDPASSSLMTHQEPGTRPACPLPYQLYADGRLSEDKKSFELNMEARNEVFGKKSAGAPFKVYAPGKYLSIQAKDKQPKSFEGARSWDYSVTAGGGLSDNWPLNAFEEDGYHLRVYGPNGFYREFLGTDADPALQVKCDDERSRMLKSKLTGNAALKISNLSQDHSYNLEITDNAYQNKPVSRSIAAGSEMSVTLDLKKSFGWYDFTLRVKEFPAFSQRFAGRVETGKESHSDPAMGRVIS
jgi:phospholipase C